jgi:hypothetical protein
MQERIARLEAERDQIARDLAAIGEDSNMVTLNTAVVERFRKDFERLSTIIGDQYEPDLIKAVRAFVDSVTAHAPKGRGSNKARN